jgi:hypothetical protein
MLSAYGEPGPPSQFQWWHGVVLGLLALLLAGGIGFGGWYWWSHRAKTAQAQSPPDSNPVSVPANSSPPRAAPSTSTSAPGQTTGRSADEEFKRLRERRISARPSESSEIVAAFADAEKKYPADYRYPYERAKLSIKGVTSHHDAFTALSAAAEKAIDNGRAQEMLDSLMADKDGDFFKVSRGHSEWKVLLDALSNKDKGSLKQLPR